MGARLLRLAWAVLLYPRTIWRLSALPATGVSKRLGDGRAGRVFSSTVRGLCYTAVGLPATVLLTGEILISANSLMIGEEYDAARIQSDFAEGIPASDLVVPGPPTPAVAPATNATSGEAYRDYLTRRFAPVIVQRISHHPEWDIPIALDYDGNANPRDNVRNEPTHRPHLATVYGQVTAETLDSYYLTYSLYHVKDYDHPIRERVSNWTYHDNDNEGLQIRIDKRSLEVVEVETWFHNRFLLFNRTGESAGTEPVHGRIYTEGGARVLVYAQPLGHGVRLLQHVDLPLTENVKILRYRSEGPTVRIDADRSVQVDGTYELAGFDEWYAAARGPLAESGPDLGMFEDSLWLGTFPDGAHIALGRFIASEGGAEGAWSRPKPMWSWDDGWDDVPIAYWHLFPSIAFESHGGTVLSHRYEYNAPVEQIFGVGANELLKLTSAALTPHRRPGEKWALLEQGHHVVRQDYWALAILTVKSYVNYVFHALG